MARAFHRARVCCGCHIRDKAKKVGVCRWSTQKLQNAAQNRNYKRTLEYIRPATTPGFDATLRVSEVFGMTFPTSQLLRHRVARTEKLMRMTLHVQIMDLTNAQKLSMFSSKPRRAGATSFRNSGRECCKGHESLSVACISEHHTPSACNER